MTVDYARRLFQRFQQRTHSDSTEDWAFQPVLTDSKTKNVPSQSCASRKLKTHRPQSLQVSFLCTEAHKLGEELVAIVSQLGLFVSLDGIQAQPHVVSPL